MNIDRRGLNYPFGALPTIGIDRSGAPERLAFLIYRRCTGQLYSLAFIVQADTK